MSVQLIDSHAHLDFEEYGPDRAEVIARARAAGVTRVVLIGLWKNQPEKPLDFGNALELATAEPGYFSATIGCHPHDVARLPPEGWAHIEKLAGDPRIVGIGETGLDFHYDHSPRPDQIAGFQRHIAIAREARKPLVVHVREADVACAEVLRGERVGERGGIIHCFTGNWERARAYLDLGFHLSVAGVVTFKSADDLRDAVRRIPRERLLIETDCPFLAPVPHRGKRNEPAYLAATAKLVAELQGLPVEELGQVTADNARRVFAIA